MKAFPLPALAIVVFATSALVSAGEPARPAADAPDRRAVESTKLPVLKVGMAAEQVIKLIGKPIEVQPMKVSEGVAEVWIYRRPLKTEGRQVQTGTQQVQGFTTIGNGGMSSVSEPVWGMEYRTTYQVTRLLIFEGKLAAATQASEVSTSYLR